MTNTRKEPTVSVLMTAYNREDYIAEAIESVLGSTFSDFELIIVDDQSSDNTLSIAHEYKKRDDRIRIFKNEMNLGDYHNRNKAASHACGKYLKYLDSDDIIYPNGLEIMVRSMEKFPVAGIGFTIPYEPDILCPFLIDPNDIFKRYYLHKKRCFDASPGAVILTKQAFKKVGGFSGKRYVGDFELWQKIAKIYPSVLIQQGIMWSRYHDGQESKANRTDIRVLFAYHKVSDNEVLATTSPLSDEDKLKVKKILTKQKTRLILKAILRGEISKGLRMYEDGNFKNIFQFVFATFSNIINKP